jgi:glycosyltransferase involved in cell wall biosynthesis
VDEVVVIHNGSDPPPPAETVSVLREKLGLPVPDTLVGFFAQIIEHKGVFDLLDAGNLAMNRDPSLGVVIAGSGPEVERLFGSIRESPHADRVTVLPPQEDIWALLAAVDIVAVPSLWPDPLPRSVMEAMAAGRPVVAYRTGGIPEMVVDGSTGFLVEPRDVSGFAAALERLSRDRLLRQRFGGASLLRVRRDFSFKAHLDSMEKLLVEAAIDSGRHRVDRNRENAIR